MHLLLSVPPHLAPSRVMQAIKGKTSHHLLMDRRKLREEFSLRRRRASTPARGFVQPVICQPRE
ncbi:MAG: transposase [Deltaproteobacteria bacterium]|nr:transposase [Deltaproteobacteria bacterium]